MINSNRHAQKARVRIVIAVMAALAPSLGSGSAAQAQDSDVDEMRKEIRSLQAQVQALRAAINEAIDLDRQKIAALNRALKGGTAEAAAAAPPPPKAETVEAPRLPAPTKAPPTRTASAAPSLGKRRAAEEPSGVIRGRVEVPANEPVAYVYVENIFEPAVKGRKEVIEQREKHFSPRWAVIQRGTTIEFPNNDNIYHNVFSLSSGNSFDLGLYSSSSEAKSWTFNEPGAVDIYCNIHPQMAASTLVVPNKHFARVKKDGTYEIAGVPPGKRKVVAWAPGSQLTSQWVELEGGGAATLNLKLESKAAGHKNKAGRAYGSYE